MELFAWIVIIASGAIGIIAGIYNFYTAVVQKRGFYIVQSILSIGISVFFLLYGIRLGAADIKQMPQDENKKEYVISVYDKEGNEIKNYEGKFDIKNKKDSILFDDETGKRHVIYFTTGTVTVDEK